MGKNSKSRRFKRDLHKTRGPSGTPHPWGPRSYRRSKEGKQEIADQIFKLETLREQIGGPRNYLISPQVEENIDGNSEELVRGGLFLGGTEDS